MMKRHTILLYFALLMPCCGIQAQDTLWVRYDNRFQRNVEQDITNVDSIEVKSSQFRLFSPTATKTVTVTPDKATVMFTNPGRYLLKPNTYSGTNYENQKATQGYNFAHSVESEHFVVFWDVRFGDNPTRIKHPNNGSVANAYNVLDIAERCWDVYVNDLGFIVPGNSTTDRYKVQLYIPYQSEWRADASGDTGVTGGMTGLGHFNPGPPQHAADTPWLTKSDTACTAGMPFTIILLCAKTTQF